MSAGLPTSPAITGANGAAPDDAAAAEVVATASAAPDAEEVRYAGLVTRVIAFAADAAVIDGVALLVGVVSGSGCRCSTFRTMSRRCSSPSAQ